MPKEGEKIYVIENGEPVAYEYRGQSDGGLIRVLGTLRAGSGAHVETIIELPEGTEWYRTEDEAWDAAERKAEPEDSEAEPPKPEIETIPFGNIGDVALYRQHETLPNGMQVTRVVGIRNGKEVSVPTAYFPMPEGYYVNKYHLEYVHGDILGVKEFRSFENKYGATIVVRDDSGITTYEVGIVKTRVVAPKPIGRGVFGDIYDQFKGKLREAFDFLMKRKSGDLLGVFHRAEIGDIDLVWGDDGGGLSHIISKHVGAGKSFENINEAISAIDNIIKNGKKDFENGDRIVFRIGNSLVTVRKNWRERGKKKADKNWILTAYDETSADSESPVATNYGQAGKTTGDSDSKVSESFETGKGEAEKNVGEVAMPSQQTEQQQAAPNQSTPGEDKRTATTKKTEGQKTVEKITGKDVELQAEWKPEERLAKLRAEHPDRVFAEEHDDGSLTFRGEDALLVCELLGRDFDGEDLTLPREDANKALQKLVANGHKAGLYRATEAAPSSTQTGGEDSTAADGGRFSLTDEKRKEIERKAKADGTWMKAPDGTTSRLDERQWAEVRTAPFKDWFGDWELAARLKAVKKLAAINSAEYKMLGTPEKTYMSLGTATNENDGTIAKFDHDAFKKNHKIGGKFETIIPALKAIFEKSILLSSEKDQLAGTARKDGTIHKTHRSVKEYRQYIGKALINGDEEYVRFTVRMQTNQNGIHNVFVTDVDIYNNLFHDASLANSNVGARLVNGRVVDTKLERFFETAKDAEINSSKIVGENGEPLVVYHGTNGTETVRRWNEDRHDYDTEHSRFTVFRRRVDGLRNYGAFFNSSEDNAGGYGNEVYAVYLNMRNPLVIDCRGRSYSDIEYDGEVKDTYDWADYAERMGYDGVVFKNVRDGVDYGGMMTETDDYVVFRPNQIKSATENVGTFDSGKADIRFSYTGKRRRKVFGGNRGYVGYSKSKRAVDAEARGLWNKAIAYGAVKDVIEKGVFIGGALNHKGRGYNTVVVAAPIIIGEERFVCAVVLHRNKTNNRFYLHEVTAQKNLQDDVFVTNLGQNPASFGDIAKLLKEIVSAKENGENVTEDTAKVKRTMQEDRDMMRSAVQQMGEKLHTDINIIEDVNDIEHSNKAIQERRRKSKGWYDTATGEVNIVLANNRDVEDATASVMHETVAHKGLRELIGEEHYDEFLDETYQHLRDDLKKGVDAAAGRAFIDDTTKNGKRAKSYEQHRRTAVDELFGRLAEKPFEEFSEGERTLWQKIKATVRRLLDKFLGSLKLPKWFELGDNELRYILWRSKERLERGKEHPIDLARDIVKREELGLGEDNTLYSETKKDAHPTRLQTSDDAQAVQRDAHLSGTKVEINSENREEIDKNLSSLAEKVAESQLPAEEFLAELRKSMKTESEDHSGYNIQVIDGEQLTMRISDHHANAKHNKQNGEFKVVSVVIKTPYSNNRFRPHKEVEMVEYTFDADKLTHDNEQNIVAGIQQWMETGQCDIEGAITVRRSPRPTSEDSAVYRDPDETEDIWTDGSLGFDEMITRAAVRLSDKHRDDKTMKQDAYRAIGGNLTKSRQAMEETPLADANRHGLLPMNHEF